MIHFELTNGEKTYLYSYPETAAELTIGKIIDYEQHIKLKRPDILTKLDEIEEEDKRQEYLDSVDSAEMERALLSLYMREIQFFTGMNLEHLRLIPVKDADGIDVFSLRNLIRRAFTDAKAAEITSFKFLGKTYYLPAAPPNLFNPDEKDYMRGSKIGEYATASELLRSYHLMKKGETAGLLNVIAVLCRKKGEELPVYPDEQTAFIRDRVELFRGLDYQTALNVGFFLSRPKLTYQNVLQSLQAVRAVRIAMYRKNTVSI